MASVSEVVSILSTEMGEDESFVRQVARSLIDDNLLPKSKGRDIAQVKDSEIVMLMLAVLSANQVNSSTAQALKYFGLQNHDHGGEHPLLGHFITECLTSLKSNSYVEIAEGGRVKFGNLRIEVITSYPLAFVQVLSKSGKPSEVLTFARNHEEVAMWPSSRPRKSVTVPGHCLKNIAAGITKKDVKAD